MICKMTRYSFILLSGDEAQFLTRIQELGMLDIKRSVKPVDEYSTSLFAQIDALRKRISAIENENFKRDELYNSLCASLKEAQEQLKSVSPWGEFDSERISGLSEKGLQLHFHCIAAKKFDEAWKGQYPLEVISTDGRNTWFVTVGTKGEKVEYPFGEVPAPLESESAALLRVKEIEAKKSERETFLREEKKDIPSLQAELDAMAAQLDCYLAKAGTEKAADDALRIYTAFALTEKDAELQKTLDAIPGVYYVSEAAKTEDNPPIELKNGRIVSMFEFFTDMYGRPAYNGFDPTVYVAIFFSLFFGMCMGDAGYGLIVLLAGLAMSMGKGGMSKFGPLISILGASTVICGLGFHTVFSVDLLTLSWFPESLKAWMLPSKIAGYDGSMVAALIVGIFHLCVAITVKTVYSVKNNGVAGSLPALGWELFLVGGSLLGALAACGVVEGDMAKTVMIVIACVAAVFIYPFRSFKKNPLLNIGAGLWETYNTATGLLGDVLSYLRIYALGLAGSMLGLAFNSIASQVLGDGPAGWIPFVLIVIIGHTLNLAIAALGAFVHPLRLNFLEFFKNSEYDASGKAFNPLKK